MPTRIQRKRTAGWTAPLDAQGRKPVYVGRGTRWGNPFAVDRNGDRWRVVDTGDRSRSLRDEPQTFARNDKPMALFFASRLFDLHTGPLGLYEYDPATLTELRAELGGRDLMCWCPTPEPGEPDYCHAVVLLHRANQSEETTR
ncbi:MULTISPECIES: DUF4326 domain-containing protein [unclassified Streptomyces]|uniref:DUF4326 domain-containing protein n=1 Tax=unclassified Streptomyces TaxID=2593676 RepID=UPI0033F280A1